MHRIRNPRICPERPGWAWLRGLPAGVCIARDGERFRAVRSKPMDIAEAMQAES